MNLPSTIPRLLAVSALGLLVGSPAVRAACEGQVFYRLWQPGGAETWYDAGEEIDIQSGEEGHIYLHTRAGGQQHFSTSARYGYPGDFGYQGDANTVARSVRMEAQNGDDRRSGRVRFRADQAGLVYIGYEINGVLSPGSLDNVSRNCRIGLIPIRVVAGGRGGGDRGGGDRGGGDRGGGDRGGGDRGGGDRGGRRGNASREAAENLVGYLYVGILQRDEAGQLDSGFLRLAEQQGREGLALVAGSMLKSPEFHNQARRRLQNEQGRINDRDELTSALLWAMYGYLYGEDAEPPERRADQDFDLLADCFDGNTRSCDALGRSLISNRLYEEGNADDLEALE